LSVPDTAAERKRRQRERQRLGLARLELWARPEHHAAIKEYAEKLEQERKDE
jgi:hypothetical protein